MSLDSSLAIYLLKMKGPIAILSLFLFLWVGLANHQLLCPSEYALKITQGSVTASINGQLRLTSTDDIHCYNYTLPTFFNCTPGIAIAVNDLETAYSRAIFFSIKAIAAQNNGIVTFVIRTHNAYTRWNKIRFNFIAEATSQIEAGYYQVQTGPLSGCCEGKDIMAFLPIISSVGPNPQALTFLSGFEMASMLVNSSYATPYQIQIVKQSVTAQGISVLISSTSATRVHSLFISYIAYDPSIQNMVAGNYLYNLYVPRNSLQYTPSIGVSDNNVAFHGFSGFIMNNNQISAFSIEGEFFNSNLAIVGSSSFYYLSYSYFFLIGGPCGQCSSYYIHYNGQCMSACPPGSYYNGATCVVCSAGQIWDGSRCLSRCSNGQYWNSTQNACTCPNGLHWNGGSCINCPNTQVWSNSLRQCACPQGTNWNGFLCIRCESGQIWHSTSMKCDCPPGQYWNKILCVSCPQGQIWSSLSNSCVCPQGSNWNGIQCIRCDHTFIWHSQTNSCGCPHGYTLFQGICASIPTCKRGQTLDPQTNTCVCQPGSHWNGFICIACTHGQIWNPNTYSCACPNGFNWNGYSCVTCQSGQVWNHQTGSCSCPNSHHWNGFNCITCDGGRIWHSQLNSCQCKDGLHWTGGGCATCAPGSHWNGYGCITCEANQVWNEANSACQCAKGQQWNGNSCIYPCPAGFISQNGLCSCPVGYYDLNGRCIVTPSCPSGQTWDGTRCVPIQCPPGTSWNGTLCLTTTVIVCPVGTFYDGCKCVTNTTTCPPGTSWNGHSCTGTGLCPSGTYEHAGRCVPISQLCPHGLQWRDNQCVPTSNQCPPGTYLRRTSCIPYQPCTDGRVWNTTVTQCVCPTGTFWNGQMCMKCSGNQIYQSNVGCVCPSGTFYDGSQCTSIEVNRCASIANSVWNGQYCECNAGYSVIGMECVCEGLAISSTFCDRCYYKPNSSWLNGICQCISGYAEINGRCAIPTTPTSPSPSCNVATYFDDQQKRCLPCSSGCLSCTTCYECTSCQPGFYLDFASSLCVESCGDSKRFTLECDDGNNNDGDGCSSDCHIEVGYNCVGGSPNSKDTCTKRLPPILELKSTGQSHLYGKIVLNVHVNYLPLELVKSATDCANKCDSVLQVRIISGDKAATSIVASYIPTSSFVFAVEIDFSREPIGMFAVEVGINPNLVQKYFSGINVNNKLIVDVMPAFMAKVTTPKDTPDVLS